MMSKRICKNIALLFFLLAFLGGQVYVLRMVTISNAATFLQINEEHDNDDDSRDELDSKKLANVSLVDVLALYFQRPSFYKYYCPSYYDGDFSTIFGPPPDLS